MEAGSYRPISVLPVLARIFEKAVAKQLGVFCNTYNVIPSEQFGFRSQSSCETALIAAMEGWMKDLDQGKVVGSLLIDLSKAFDTVSHQQLLNDLSEIGCSTMVCNWFCSYLSGREQRVTRGAVTTECRSVTRGVPQGSCLSPLLFNIYVRDLPQASTSPTVQFADDITQSEADIDEEVIVGKLAESFMKTFCESRKLLINTSKTQFIIFKSRRRRISDELEILLDGIAFKPLFHVNLLGVTLNRHLTF